MIQIDLWSFVAGFIVGGMAVFASIAVSSFSKFLKQTTTKKEDSKDAG